MEISRADLAGSHGIELARDGGRRLMAYIVVSDDSWGSYFEVVAPGARTKWSENLATAIKYFNDREFDK